MDKRVIFILGILLIGGVFGYNSLFNSSLESASRFGIDGGDVMISIRGNNISLDEALFNDYLGTCNPLVNRSEAIVDFNVSGSQHYSYEINVKTSAGVLGLQEAIHKGYLGGGAYNTEYTPKGNPEYFGHSGDEVIINFKGQQKTLQQAIDDGGLSGRDCCGDGVCDSGVGENRTTCSSDCQDNRVCASFYKKWISYYNMWTFCDCDTLISLGYDYIGACDGSTGRYTNPTYPYLEAVSFQNVFSQPPGSNEFLRYFSCGGCNSGTCNWNIYRIYWNYADCDSGCLETGTCYCAYNC